MGTIREAFQGEASRGKWLVVVSVALASLVVTALIFIALSVSSIGDSVKRIDALHYPVPQEVNNRLSGIDYDGPALRLGDQIQVTGTKCLSGDVNVVTFGVTTQAVMSPVRLNSEGEIAANLRQPGCTTSTYSNTLDPAIATHLRALFDNGIPFVVMRITGFESPVDQHFSSVDWYTEDFRVYPPKPTTPGPGSG